MNDPLTLLRRFIQAPVAEEAAKSADIPTLTQVAQPLTPADQPPAGASEELVDQMVREYLPIIEHELRRRLRERATTQKD